MLSLIGCMNLMILTFWLGRYMQRLCCMSLRKLVVLGVRSMGISWHLVLRRMDWLMVWGLRSYLKEVIVGIMLIRIGIRISLSWRLSNVVISRIHSSMDSDKNGSKMAICTSANSKMEHLMATVCSKTPVKRIGWVEHSRRVILSICYSTTIKVNLKSMIE